MATSCTSTATATTTSVTTFESTSISLSTSITTLPPTVTTITTAQCEFGNFTDFLCVSTTSTLTSTISGETSTVTVSLTETVPVTSSTVLTLFGPPICTTFASSSGNASLSLSTPPPTSFTTQSTTTLPNGQVSTITEVITSSLSPSIVYVNPTPGDSNDQTTQNNTDGSNSPRIAPIVGGVVAGFFGLIGIVLIIWFILKRRRRWDDIFDQELPTQPSKRFSLDAALDEPKPYQYGLVGHTRSPPPLSATPTPPSPPLTPGRGLAPLMMPMTVSQPGLSAGTSLSLSRPSTAGSMRPLHSPSSPPPQSHHHNTSSGSSTGVHISPSVPSPREWGHHVPSPSADTIHMDSQIPAVRVGSPTSVRDYDYGGRMYLANVGDNEVLTPPTPSPLAAAAAASGSGTTDRRPALLDGKGRNVRLGSGGPGVLVHTDGGPAPPDLLL
ncbi:hypothetical protein HMN09_00004200 [Mycena chlorophos]|uniref:Uncharacterized protein n=1 Tax=Mycena chlorophos TaxID=658473 RepID=A0A8H6TQR8_MYCCL|nr:hypothetical protein HMN09_00004200 [Mycena chlorophos]